jgi:hypothetical protein
MSLRKHKLDTQCQQYATVAIGVEASKAPLTKRDSTALHKYRDQRQLTVSNLHAESLDFLTEWRELRSLRMYGCKVPDCWALTRLPKFRHLWYHTNRDKTPDLSFLSALKHIESLGVGYVTYLESFPDLSTCLRLQELKIFSCKRLRDISTLAAIPKLQRFSIVDTPQMPRDLEQIMTLKTLKKMSGAFGSNKQDELFHQLLAEHALEYG